MFMKVNLPILVNSFADREYVLNIPFLYDNKGHVHLLQDWILEICLTLKAFAKCSLLHLFKIVFMIVCISKVLI